MQETHTYNIHDSIMIHDCVATKWMQTDIYYIVGSMAKNNSANIAFNNIIIIVLQKAQ